jgi:hypothetical protein
MADMPRWEYRVETAGSFWSGPKPEDLAEFLCSLGEEGWELISILNFPNSEKLRIVAKRPILGTYRQAHKWPEGF